MAVVVDSFEVVQAPPPPAAAQAPAADQQAPPPDPALAEQELERAERRLLARAARLHAT
jgi:hypothetical protein